MANDFNMGTDAWTTSLWYKCGSQSPATLPKLMGSVTDTASSGAIQLLLNTAGTNPSCAWRTASDPATGGLGPTLSCGTTKAVDTWHLIVVTRDASDFRLYVDGELEDEAYVATTDTCNWSLGGLEVAKYTAQGSSGKYLGSIDEIRIYKGSAASPDEIRSMYANPSGVSRATENTDQLADGAGLGNTANWSQVVDDDGNKAEDNATVGATWDVNITNQPTSIVQTFYQATEPVSGVNTGDYWIDSDDNKTYRYNGSSWDLVQDDDIATAIADAATAQATADGKITTFVSASDPTAEGEGDLWLDSSDGYKMHRWSGSAWEEVQDAGIATAISNAATAQATADGKVTTFVGSSTPTAEGEGDLWIDTGNGNLLKRWSGSAWEGVQDTDISQALADAATAQSTADGKIVSYFQTSEPTGASSGDLWFDTDDDNKPYRYNGSTWDPADNPVANWSKILDDDGNRPANGADVTPGLPTDEYLVAHWAFDDPNATAIQDRTGNGNTGTIYGTPTFSTGVSGSALALNGSNQYMDVADNDVFNMGTGDWSLSLWWFAQAQSNLEPTLICSGGNWVDGDIRVAFDHPGVTANTILWQHRPNYQPMVSSVVSLNMWHHLVIVRNSTLLSLYIDGVYDKSITIGSGESFDWSFSGEVRIGRWSAANSYLLGAVDEVRFYKGQALTAQQIKALYLNPSGPIRNTENTNQLTDSANLGKTADWSTVNDDDGNRPANGADVTPGLPTDEYLVAHWAFDDPNATAIQDRSGKGNTGTISGTPTFVSGASGSAIEFDGSSDSILVATDTDFYMDLTDWSISFWFNAPIQSNAGASFFGTGTSWESGALNLRFDGAGGYTQQVEFITYDGIHFGSSLVAYNQWHHVTLTRSGDTMKLYINGELDVTETISAIATFDWTYGGGLYLGWAYWNGTAGRFDGSMDEVRFYKGQALTAQQVKALYLNPSGPIRSTEGTNQLEDNANLGGTATWSGVSGTGKPEDDATVGAQAGVNLKDSGGSNLGDSDIKNTAITINADGTLSGAGSGQVTIAGIGGEPSITKSTTAPSSPAVDDVWFDMNFDPIVIKTWSGSAWTKATPTELDEIDDTTTYKKFTATEQTKLTGVADGATANTGALADMDTVGTDEIDDDSVFSGGEVFTASSSTISGSTWTNVQSLSVTATGDHIRMGFYVDMEYVGTGYAFIEARIRRGSSQVIYITTQEQLNPTLGMELPLPGMFLDHPVSGSYTYYLDVWWTGPSGSIYATNRSIVANEWKGK